MTDDVPGWNSACWRNFKRRRQNCSALPANVRPTNERVFAGNGLERFPYLIFFLELPDCIWLAAVAHGAREPDYWKHRTPEF